MRNIRWWRVLLLCGLGACAVIAPQPPTTIKHWAVYYGSSLPASTFKGLDLIVFDRRYHPPIKSLKKHAVVLAYVSVGEIYDDAPEKKQLDEEKAILFQQQYWKSHIVDPTSPRWRTMVLAYVDDAIKQGFSGVMLDTVDSPLDWATTNAPARRSAMMAATVLLIQDIRAAHPNMKIMLNRGLDMLPDVASKIDYVLAESIMTNTDVSTGQFSMFPPTTYAILAARLHTVAAGAPALQILTLDYWNPDDVKTLDIIYATQRAAGFAPYVTTHDLMHFTPEPRLSLPPAS